MKTTRNLWPFGVIAAFGLFFIGMASVVVIAATHRDSLVSNSYYEQELKFQSVIDASTRAKNAGATIAFDAASGRVTLALPVAQMQLKPSGKVQLYRPSAAGLDREFLLEPKNDGTQTLNISALTAGLWQVRAVWNVGGQDYRLEQKITIAGQ
jgi:hypothetical protein